ncbi:hypothetical protein [uncultured Tolumonas sp.]|uniref:hypothetical protein n=1 Tax=uncultured Tolumonas sp. TaxID=263765 RepID=UPI00292DDE3D|nr:hypothetical protein [uncultured Tolumonas sp.]
MNRLKYLVGLAILLAITCRSFADTAEMGSWSVSSLRFAPEGLYVQFNPAPASCGGGNQYRMHARVPNTATNYKELISALLTAYTTGQSLNFIFVKNEGVCSSTSILELYMVEFTPK